MRNLQGHDPGRRFDWLAGTSSILGQQQTFEPPLGDWRATVLFFTSSRISPYFLLAGPAGQVWMEAYFPSSNNFHVKVVVPNK
jgi:hypothetical protein